MHSDLSIHFFYLYVRFSIALYKYETIFIQLMYCMLLINFVSAVKKMKPITMGIRMRHPNNIISQSLQYPIHKRIFNGLNINFR